MKRINFLHIGIGLAYTALSVLAVHYFLWPQYNMYVQEQNEAAERKKLAEDRKEFIDNYYDEQDDTAIFVNDSVSEVDSLSQKLILPVDSAVNKPNDSIPANLRFKPRTYTVYSSSGKTLLGCNSMATTYLSSPKVNIPDACQNINKRIATLLSKDENATITAIVYTGTDEASSIGSRRASTVKDLLVAEGVDAKRIKTDVRRVAIPYELGVAKGAVFFTFTPGIKPVQTTATKPDDRSDQDQPETTKEELTAKTFTTGFIDKNYYGDQRLSTYIAQLKRNLDDKTIDKILIYGQVIPGENADTDLEYTRANVQTVRRLMVESGIKASQIITYARGSNFRQGETPQNNIKISYK